MALRLLIAHTPAERYAAREVEAQVFLQAFGNTPEVMEQEYGAYQERSRFVTVIDEEAGVALGVARLILPDAEGPVKSLVDVAADPWHLDGAASLRAAGLGGGQVWDVGSLAVDRRFRTGASGAEVTVALCHGVLQHSLAAGTDGLVTILDDRILRVVRAMGMPSQPMEGATSRSYPASPASTPCVMRMDAVAESIRTRRPELATAIVDGVFRSIVVDQADLSADRAAPLDPPDPMPARSAAPRRDTTAWRPPTARPQAAPTAAP